MLHLPPFPLPVPVPSRDPDRRPILSKIITILAYVNLKEN
jgi:hypothetical protein